MQQREARGTDSLRQAADKSAFAHFLPAFINPAHASGSAAWGAALRASLLGLGRERFGAKTVSDAAFAVLPRLLNTLTVEMMKPGAPKSAAIALFEALGSFWRTLVHLLGEDAALRRRAVAWARLSRGRRLRRQAVGAGRL